ncbi:SGNH/GDSL hydrolase family protein, partial [Magnetococcales bacterium HHB-1]
MSQNTPSSRWAPLLVPLFTILFCFAILEIGLIIAFHHSMDFHIEMWKYAKDGKKKADNPLLGHEHVPHFQAFLMGADVHINSKKLRDREFDYQKPEQTFRILMLGDSVTFGWGVRVQDTVSKLLEHALNAKPDRKHAFEVINTGVGNYNTQMQTDYFFSEGYKYQPNLILLNYFINDAEPRPQRTENFWLEHSYAAVYLLGKLDSILRQSSVRKPWQDYYSDLYKPQASGWKIAKKSIKRLAHYSQKNQIPLIFINYPELHELKNYPFQKVNQQLQQLTKQEAIPYIDLLPSIKDEKPESLWV